METVVYLDDCSLSLLLCFRSTRSVTVDWVAVGNPGITPTPPARFDPRRRRNQRGETLWR